MRVLALPPLPLAGEGWGEGAFLCGSATNTHYSQTPTSLTLTASMTVSPVNLGRARRLRRNSTDAEQRLWRLLRSRRFNGFKIRRQHILGVFIVDFVCLEKKIVIELDGGQHATAVEADAMRTRYVQARGFRVIRFWNNEVLENMGGVWEAIAKELKIPLTPTLSPKGRGGRAPLTPTLSPKGRVGRRSLPLPLAGEGRGEGPSRTGR